MTKKHTEDEDFDLSDQIGNLGAETSQEPGSGDEGYKGTTGMLGGKLTHMPGQRPTGMEFQEPEKKASYTRIGENINQSNEIRDGWMPVDRTLLGDRDQFYPEDWEFRIRPATVDAIKNWSSIDDENVNSIDDVFNEILKSCLSIRSNSGPVAWSMINSWDRFFFIILIREYTFEKGESKIEFSEDCPNCDNPVTFTLSSQSLYWEMPDKSLIAKYWSPEDRCWVINTEEFGLNKGVIQLYVPTLEKDANIKQWIFNEYNAKKRFERSREIFVKYLVWMLPKASKDETILKRQIRECEMEYRQWDIDEFTWMESVINNITVTPETKLIETCPTCGEEVTQDVRFPNGIRSLFTIQSKFTKFGTK